MKIVQDLENSNVLLKGVTKINKSETKEQKARFLSMLLDTLRASLLGNLWTGKGEIARRKVREILTGYGAKRACYGLKQKILIPPHTFTNFEIQKYYENEPRFNGVFSRNNFPKTIKTGAYVVNFDEYVNIGTH